MQSAGDLVSLAAELAASVEDGHDDLERRLLELGLLVDRNTSTVVGDGDGVVGVNHNLDLRAVAGQASSTELSTIS